MIEQPTAEHLAFHEELKGILDKHQQAIGEIHIVAIMSQVAGSVGAIAMFYDGLTRSALEQTIAQNARMGIGPGWK